MAPRASRHPADRSARVSTAQGASIRDDAYETTRARRAVRLHVPRRSVARGPPRLRSRERFGSKTRESRFGARFAQPRNETTTTHDRCECTPSLKKKKFPTDASSNDASSYRRLTATLLPPRASRLPPAFFPDDDARRTPRPGSTRRARAKSAPTRMTTKNPETVTVWRRCKPRDARRSRSLHLHRKPTASTRASAISTSRVTRGHRFSRAS